MSIARDRSCPMNAQAVGWALHALEPDEEIEVLLHVPQCVSCQMVVRDAEELLSHLGASVEQLEPRDALRDAILAAATDTPQRLPILRPRTSPESTAALQHAPAPRHRAATERGSTGPGSPSPEAHPPRGRRSRRLVAASLALVGVLTIGGLAVRTAQLEQQRATETSQAQSLTDLVTQLDRPGAKHALLAGGNSSTIAAVLVADGQRQVFTLGLPANAAERNTYVLWGISAGADPQPLGTFDVATPDGGRRTVGSEAAADGFTAYAISIEPGRTAPGSPSEVVAKGQVAV